MAAKRKGGAGTPFIGITMDVNFGRDGGTSPAGTGGRETAVFWLNKSYVDAVESAGGIPVLIPVITSPKKIQLYLSMIDGLILSGGDFDIDPKLYGEKPVPQIGTLKPDRTLMEMGLLKAALKIGMPTLGVCGGHQAINVAYGGSLWQDIPSQIPSAIKHSQSPAPSTKPSHEVSVVPGSLLADIVGGKPVLKVNSTHHQCVKKLGKGLVASSTSSDGLAESVELIKRGARFLLGVQWHPERLCGSDEPSASIFRRLVDCSAQFRKGR